MENKEVKEYPCCLRCGRKLKNPEARKLGYGKICYTKTIVERWHRKTLFEVFTNKS